jgi:hypothetical protein
MQDIERRILIPIHDQPAMGAGMGALAQFLLNLLATVGAHLGCIAGVHQHNRSASFFRFADGHADKLAPRHIHDALAQRAPFVRSHLLRCKVFKYDRLIAVNQFSAALVGEVRSSVCYPLVNVGQCLLAIAVLIPLLRVLGRIFELLNALEISFVAAVETWIGNLLTIRQRSERHQAHIYTHTLGRRWQSLWLDFNREADVPLTRSSAAQCDGLDRAFDWTVQDDMDCTNFREDEAITGLPYAVPVLRVGDRIVATKTFETRIARVFGSLFHAAKERLKCEINTLRDVLQHLRMHQFERWSRFLPERQHGFRLVPGERNALFVGITTRHKCLVINPPAFLKLLPKNAPLAVREVDAIFERLAYQTPFWLSMY